MSKLSEPFHLVSRYCDGEITPEELADFETRLLNDSDFAQQTASWVLAHRQLADVFSEDRLHDLIDQVLVGRPGPPPGVFAQLDDFHRPDQPIKLEREGFRWLAPAATAALILIAFLPFGLNWFASPNDSSTLEISPHSTAQTRPDRETAPPETPAIAASLAELIDVTWPSVESRLEPGQLLHEGSRVVMTSGRAKVTFDCGAEVVLEGPCDFELQSRMAGLLRSGKLTADVPRRAFGFGIICPKVDLIDLGTSFGVNVDERGGTELHVFEGEVLCNPSGVNDKNRQDLLHVRENEAKSFPADRQSTPDIAFDSQQFERLQSVRRPFSQDHGPGVPSDLALWLAADRKVATDDQDGVISWHDILYGDNRSAEDALQVEPQARPLLAPNAMNGLPAIRFDGTSDFLLTTPLETTDDQTVALVCQFSPEAFRKDRIWGGQILNYDGPPSRYLSNTLEPGVLQIGEPLLESQFRPALITGQVFSGFVGATTVEAGRVDAEPIGANRPTLVVYRYSYSEGRSELWLNGLSAGQARAFAPQEITSRKIIGRHAWMQLFFQGDLSEMLIYNKALTPVELSDITAYLSTKYRLDIE